MPSSLHRPRRNRRPPARGAHRTLTVGGAVRRAWDIGPLRRELVRRLVALCVAVSVATSTVVSHRQGLELAEAWGEVGAVLVVDEPVAAGEPLEGRVSPVHFPLRLLPDGSLAELPRDATASVDLGPGDVLTDRRTHRGPAGTDPGATGARALVPVALQGREGAAPAELTVDDAVDVIAPGGLTTTGEREPARVVASAAVVRSVDAAAVTLDVAADDVPGLADALLHGPVVLTVLTDES